MVNETPHERQAEAVRLRGDGWSTRRIAKRLGVGKSTVDRYLLSARTGRSISQVADERSGVGRIEGGPGGGPPSEGGLLTQDWQRRRRDVAPARRLFDAFEVIGEVSRVIDANWNGDDSIEGLRRARLTPNIDGLNRALVLLDEIVVKLEDAGFGSGSKSPLVTQDRVIDWEGPSGPVILPLNRRVHRRDQDQRKEDEEKVKAHRAERLEIARLTNIVMNKDPGWEEAARRLRDEFGKEGRWLDE